MARGKRTRKGGSQHPAGSWLRLLKPKAKQISEVKLLSACVHRSTDAPLEQDSGVLFCKTEDFASAMEARQHLTLSFR